MSTTAEGALNAAYRLTSNWLDCQTFYAPTFTNATACVKWPTYYYQTFGPSRPVKLKLSEIERLRAAAKRDAKLKAILAKFTDQIEIVVDFE